MIEGSNWADIRPLSRVERGSGREVLAMTDHAEKSRDERAGVHRQDGPEHDRGRDIFRRATRAPEPSGDPEFRAPPRPRDPGELQATGLVDPGAEEEEERHGDPLSRFITQGGRKKDEDDDLPEGSILPRQPRTLVDLGPSKAFLIDLSLKIIHYSGTPSVAQLTRR